MKERHPNPSNLKYENNIYVLSYPPYYTKQQIYALKAIAQRTFHRENERIKAFDDKEQIPDYIRNVHVIPEYLAAALAYGYENNNQFNEKKDVVIIDIGYYCTYCVNCSYERGKCVINNTKYSFDISGSNIDERIFKTFKQKIEEDDGHKEKLTDKDLLKIRMELSKVKEKLSASGADTVQVNVDGVLDDDEDYSGEFSVGELNDLIVDMPGKLIELLKETVKGYDDLSKYDVVIIGGSLRIPLFQNSLEKEINHLLIRTLNMDESVSYGCIYYGAMKSEIWNYEVEYNEEMKGEDGNMLLSGKWKGIDHKMSIVYGQEKEANDAAKMRNSIEKKIYELQHKIVDSNQDYQDFCERLLGLLKHRGFVYIPAGILEIYEKEIDEVTEAYDRHTDLYILLYNLLIIKYIILILYSKMVESDKIKPTEEMQRKLIQGLLKMNKNERKGVEELLVILQNKNEEEVNKVKNILSNINKKPESKYKVGDIKEYNFETIGDNVVVIVGKEYDMIRNVWTYEIETIDGVIRYNGVDEKELKEVVFNKDNVKKIVNYYLGQKLNNGEKEIIEIFESGHISTRYIHKKKYDDYCIPE